MSQVEVSVAQSGLRGLVERARAGEVVILVEGGQEVAKLVPVTPRVDGGRAPRQLGRLDGMFTVPDDFDAPLPDDLLDVFEGKA